MMRALGLALFLFGCAASNQAARTDALLRVSSSVPSASVYVDERFAGRAADLSRSGLGVVHGTLRVEVRADGYYPAYREVTVPPGGQASVEVPLNAVPEGEQ